MEAQKHLRRHAEGSLARVIVNAGHEVAAADCRIDSREQQILHRIGPRWAELFQHLLHDPIARGTHGEPSSWV